MTMVAEATEVVGATTTVSPFPILLVFAGVFGALVGSFLNVVVYRLPRGEPLGWIRKSRSACPACDATIRWYDNLPLLSYAILRGRCRSCRCRIPFRYPLVEATTVVLFVLCALRVAARGWSPPLLAFCVVAAFTALLLAASVIDVQHARIPDALTLRAGPLIALVGVFGVPSLPGVSLSGHDLVAAGLKPGFASLLVAAAGLLVGGGVVAAIWALGTLALRRDAVGPGDVKLMAMAGLLLGPGPAVMAIGIALAGSAVFGVAAWIVTRRRAIPFGPLLAAGSWVALCYGDAVAEFVFITYPGWFMG